ncbi:MAG: translation elongation factor Ts [Clostridia bacterium]|jgi:elongation factor Ts|nr:translation elongation factor Ts [Clostridia bacterium]MDD3232153.1 translation elongation factor Ts [Clostridia bacterium]MDD3862941.1 translation elongation factor Ts [Clostridia bacterium]MDD4408330.1 translation elongation factor Ts [Clostridia bacterium]
MSAQDVAKLREITGVGILDCKKALSETNGDIDKAIVILREKGIIVAAKKAGRIAAEGLVASYIHMGGRIGVLVEMNCETDFVAKSDQFNELIKDIAMQIAASKPLYVNIDEVTPEEIENEKEVLRNQAKNEGKKPELIEKMVEGRIKKFFSNICLMEQPFIRDSAKTVKDMINEATLKIGEKIVVRRFVRYEMGEGLEKRKDDFVEEINKQIKGE